MKNIFSLVILACAALPAVAQDTYTNDRISNTSDINGTARYVGMGGAMGALGADISSISSNPAGTALIRKGYFSVGMGALIQKEEPLPGDDKAHYSFDQVGFVAPMNVNGENLKRLTFGLNFQKKIDFNHSLFANQAGLGGLSQVAQLAGIASDYWDNLNPNAFLRDSYYYGLYDVYAADGTKLGFQTTDNSYFRTTSGNLYGLDINFAMNHQDRYYYGLTIGVDFLNYSSFSSYVEHRIGAYSDGSLMAETDADYNQTYTLNSEEHISGAGINFKLGTIIYPFEENSLRIGIALESPTFYTLTKDKSYTTVYSMWKYNENTTGGYYYTPEAETYNSLDDNYLEYNLNSPWKFRVGIGSTVGKSFAWDIDYEFSLNNRTKMGYPRRVYQDYWGTTASLAMDKDRSVNMLTNNIVKGVHNIRAGFEFKPSKHIALRAGYNFYSKPFKSDARLSQDNFSEAMNYQLGTDFTNLGATNIFTCGLGWQGKHWFADMAYKYRHQKGDFYAFDDYYQTSSDALHEDQFVRSSAGSLQPVEVDLSRHNLTFTLGYKF
ncbi:MAG: hypothetical protein K6F94_02195 [Bacteroidaceae bacterium]|nr:hypothetical protein [Bacteroidaceae bacterium]